MKYRLLATEAALVDVDTIRRWIAERGAPLTARRWVERLLVALRTLSGNPTRCQVAAENAEVDEFEIRRFLFGKVRVLFTVVGAEVVILHVRHGSRRYATRDDLAPALRELGLEED